MYLKPEHGYEISSYHDYMYVDVMFNNIGTDVKETEWGIIKAKKKEISISRSIL